MDWFERLTGFREDGYEATRGRLQVRGRQLRSLINGRAFGIGAFETPSLQDLRDRAASTPWRPGRLTARNLTGDVRALHGAAANAGALFQVASQFNMLEMLSPDVTPEDGVTRYQDDHTQGPACAMAAGAATIWRNYFAPAGSGAGQTAARQLDGLSDIGDALGLWLGRPAESLWTMRNGYALCEAEALSAIGGCLKGLDEVRLDALRALLRVGLHWDVQVTDGDGPDQPRVSQAFCSALPVAYSRVPPPLWAPFARLVLDAAYEATLCAARLNADRGGSRRVLLTRLGGGAFGNDDAWIDAALRRALRLFGDVDLEVVLVSHGAPPPSMLAMEVEFA